MAKVLVFCDDRWHPAKTVRLGLAGLEKRGLEFDWVESTAGWNPASLDETRLVVLSKSNNTSATDESAWMDEAAQAAFTAFVRRGGGLLAIHSGTAGYANAAGMRALLGGIFLRHPAQCPVTVTPQPGHPLSQGSPPFTLVDEHYMMEMDDDRSEVFMITVSEHGTQPGGWLRQEGRGRVGVLTPGHNLEVWQHPSFQNLISNLLAWCGEMHE